MGITMKEWWHRLSPSSARLNDEDDAYYSRINFFTRKSRSEGLTYTS